MLARALAPLLLAAVSVSATAPFQCASKLDPDRRLEEEPAEALYALAEKFKVEGDAHARAETLRFIRAKYPSSRFSAAAEQELKDLPASK